MVLRSGHLKNGYQLWQKGGGAKKRFQCCLNPNSSNRFLYLRATQGHCAVDPTLQDNVLLPKGFTEYIFHVGNAKEVNSRIRNGLIPGGQASKEEDKLQKNLMEDGNSMGETPRALTKPRIAPYKNTWKRFQNTEYLCNLKLAQEKSLHFYQARSHLAVLYNTIPAALLLRKRYV